MARSTLTNAQRAKALRQAGEETLVRIAVALRITTPVGALTKERAKFLKDTLDPQVYTALRALSRTVTKGQLRDFEIVSSGPCEYGAEDRPAQVARL